MTKCIVEGCVTPAAHGKKGYCGAHYYRIHYNHTTESRYVVNTHCSVTGCDRKAISKTLCRYHYDQQYQAKQEMNL